MKVKDVFVRGPKVSLDVVWGALRQQHGPQDHSDDLSKLGNRLSDNGDVIVGGHADDLFSFWRSLLRPRREGRWG
jgi:hypothetical protein